MRKIVAALQVSVDGFIEGPNGELDWAMADDEEVWADVFELAVLANPTGVLPFCGREPTKNEIAYARLADKTPHLVVSRTLDKVAWKTSRIVRDVEEIRQVKQRPGKDMQVVGGATLVSSLMKAGLVDEQHALKLERARPLKSGKVALTYRTSE